jgi:hypothetical protein
VETEVISTLKEQCFFFLKRWLINRYSSIQRTFHPQLVFAGHMGVNLLVVSKQPATGFCGSSNASFDVTKVFVKYIPE